MKTNTPKREKRHVLLVNPWIYDFAAYDFWVKPLGLMMLGAILRMNGFRVTAIDCLDSAFETLPQSTQQKTPKRTPIGTGEFLKQAIPKPSFFSGFTRQYRRYGISIASFQHFLQQISPPDLVMIGSMMTYWYPGVFETIRQVKKSCPGVPVILGGNYATLCPAHSEAAGADMVISGPGECALPAVCEIYLHEHLSYRPAPEEFDSYPYPAFDLLPQNVHIPILTSRGCPFSCTYCASRILNPTFIVRDPLNVFREIEYWHRRHGIVHFSFYDDALLARPQELFIPLVKELVKHRMPCRFHCPNGLHLKEITEDMARLMYHAGFQTIRFGFETSDIKQQLATGGKVRNRDLEAAIRALKLAGYKERDIGVYLLCGLPGQEAQEVCESIHFVRACGARPIIAEYSPIPGTLLWPEAVKASPFAISEEPLYHNNTLLPCRHEKLDYAMYRELKMLTRLS